MRYVLGILGGKNSLYLSLLKDAIRYPMKEGHQACDVRLNPQEHCAKNGKHSVAQRYKKAVTCTQCCLNHADLPVTKTRFN